MGQLTLTGLKGATGSKWYQGKSKTHRIEEIKQWTSEECMQLKKTVEDRVSG